MKDNLLKQILREYDSYKMEQQRAFKEREAEILQKIPEISRLRSALVSSLAEKARNLILNPDDTAQMDENRISSDEAKGKEAALLAEYGYPEDYLTIHYRCPQCKDTGYLGDLLKVKCSCLIQQLAERSYRLSELSEVDKENFNTFDANVFPETPMTGSSMSQKAYMEQLRSVLWDYQEAYPNNPKKNILFTGKTGLGKTFLLNCLAKGILNKGGTVLKVTSYTLFEHLFRGSMQNLVEDSLILKDRIFSVNVLIIDDLGTETRRNNFTAEELFNILNERYLQQKYTFLSTNLSLSDLREFYSDRVTSRLFDTQNTMIFRFAGQDIRLRPKQSSTLQ